MRLNRLDLTRYGKFTDHSVDFGVPAEGEPDLHIIYGPNEAGKSTAFSAFLDLLFGIEMRSRFNFLHPYPAMRIGASLQLGDGTHELLRIKRPQGSLLDREERAVSEGLILGELGGIDRDAYRAMFSLDDETLEAGGETILASKGDLGQLLFSASAGLADLSRRLVELRGEADAFYKYRARNGELTMLKGELSALKDERERIDTLASDYAQLAAQRDRARLQYDEAMAERGRVQARIEQVQRLVAALPRLAVLRTIRGELTALAGLPEPPVGWADDLPGLQADEIELGVRWTAGEDEIARLASGLESLAIDDVALSLADQADSLSDLRARYMTAERDLPDRRLQLTEVDLRIAGMLERIGRPGDAQPAALVPAAAAVGTLRDLIEARSGIESGLRLADREAGEARRRLEDAQSDLQAAGGGPGGREDGSRERGMAALAAAVATVRASDHAARLRLALRARETRAETLADRMRGVRPWQGKAWQLAEMEVPGEEAIGRWQAAAADAEAEAARHAHTVERLTTERLRLEAKLGVLTGGAAIAGDEEAGLARARRESAWALHRQSLDRASADAFEAALRHDDLVAAARVAQAGMLAEVRADSQALAVVSAELARAGQLQQGADAVLRAQREALGRTLQTLSPALPADMPLARLQDWLRARDRVLEAWTALRAAEQDAGEAESDAAASRERLSAALAAAGVAFDPAADCEPLLAVGQAALDREAALAALAQAVVSRRRDLQRRERDVEEAAAAERAWAEAWSRACAGCWFGDAGTPAVAAVREILAATADLGGALEQRAGLADRIGKMEKDQAEFAALVGRLAAGLGLAVTPGGALAAASSIAGRLQSAQAQQSARAARERDLSDARAKQQALAQARAVQEGRKAEITGFLGTATLAEAAAVLERIRRRDHLLGQERRGVAEVLEAVRLPSLEEAEATLDAADRAALEAELAELKARFQDLDERSRELFSAHSKAGDQVEAIGGDDAAARLEERRQTVLAEVSDKALRYLKLRLGTTAADQALRVYRDQHRSSMMARASEAFRTVSRGAYKGLATQPDKDTEILVAVASDGASKIASDLSKGTRFQLYLALRVAGYHEFTGARRPVPFLADDIMETFDDFRAEEAFRLLGGMARSGQVIYLTHHAHLCDIARRICPMVKIHRLPG